MHEKINAIWKEGNPFKGGGFRILMDYDSGPSVCCTLIRPYVRHLAVSALGKTEDEAIDRAKDLLSKVEELEKSTGEPVPKPDGEYYQNRYYQRVIGDIRVSLKATYGLFSIIMLTQVDRRGFTVHKTPDSLEGYEPYNPADSNHRRLLESHKVELEPGESLYIWDNIRFLSGTAGLAIAKDGKIIKSLGVARG